MRRETWSSLGQNLAREAAGAESEARDGTGPLWPSLRVAESRAN